MALIDLNRLISEINDAVHVPTPAHPGKVTAPALNAVLVSLATELAAGPDMATTLAGASPAAVPTVAAVLAGLRDEQYQVPYLFQVMNAATGDAYASGGLSLAQAYQLVDNPGTTLKITGSTPQKDAFTLTLGYDRASAAFVASGVLDATADSLQVRLVGHGQPGAAAAPAPPVLEFVFEAGFADSVGRTLGTRQAGTYTGEQRQNVASVRYQVAGQPVGLPLTLAAADVLQVAITRADNARPAVLTLLS